jgi:hypothetical protein
MTQLAQLNIARMKFVSGDSRMKDFIDALDPVNATADASPGFVWRMKSESDSTPELEQFESSGWVVNMSVWEDLPALQNYIATPLHMSIMRRRAEWFEKYHLPTMVLWWVADGHRPDFAEAFARLEHLRAKGPSEYAFGFSTPFDPPERA